MKFQVFSVGKHSIYIFIVKTAEPKETVMALTCLISFITEVRNKDYLNIKNIRTSSQFRFSSSFTLTIILSVSFLIFSHCRLERLVDVLRKKVGTGSVRTVI